MINNDKEIIEYKIKSSIREIAGNSGYGYLNCYKNQWKDCEDNIHYIHDKDDMSEEYLINCLGQIERDSGPIRLKFTTISKKAGLEIFNLSEKEKEDIVTIGNKELEKLFNQKKEEIEKELEAR